MTARLRLPVVLVGLPGAGKSKVGRLVAADLGAPHVDTDALVEAEAGMSVAEVFASEGEEGFRAREARAVERALGMRAVVSLGGGAVVTPRVRELLAGHDVVHLDVEHDELVRRTSRASHRPLLRDDPAGALRRLRAERSPLYEQVETLRLRSDSGPARDVADRILEAVDPAWGRVRVGGAAPYDVLIGRGDQAGLVTEVLRPEATRVLVVHARALEGPARRLARGLEDRGLAVSLADHPDAEAGKTLEAVARLWDEAGRFRLGRADAVVALGGGATTDMAGFVAATWLRGVDLVNIPTTLLAMVDAAIGGKTGINTATGKNLVGSFHSPRRVVCDLTMLETLPAADLRAGLGEVVKCGFIDDPRILDLVEGAGDSELIDPGSSVLRELIHRSALVKARVVGADLTEAGLREILNYGHTLAHAIERCEDYSWRHGDAVAVGCVFAARLAASRGMLSQAEVDRHVGLFSRVGLPTSYEGDPEGLLDAMASDKKVRGGVLRFVLLDGLQRPVVEPVAADEVSAVLEQGARGGQ
ncbi:3-dehydroquinate synthase [Actinomyces sp. B33]|uniref:3-dehydroquinate synthase n=1 Tax=Actinomyces sp. B33 TaxID=2942131 RepID=UPI0023413AFC|nr:3-dehydroquinate synthase [Actinomyces sp. B33]MDC4233348.1 3-dehydroquinate synthase [Actinomyces sp. B33]